MPAWFLPKNSPPEIPKEKVKEESRGRAKKQYVEHPKQRHRSKSQTRHQHPSAHLPKNKYAKALQSHEVYGHDEAIQTQSVQYKTDYHVLNMEDFPNSTNSRLTSPALPAWLNSLPNVSSDPAGIVPTIIKQPWSTPPSSDFLPQQTAIVPSPFGLGSAAPVLSSMNYSLNDSSGPDEFAPQMQQKTEDGKYFPRAQSGWLGLRTLSHHIESWKKNADDKDEKKDESSSPPKTTSPAPLLKKEDVYDH